MLQIGPRDGPVSQEGNVAVIIVNYNGGDKILKCLQSLERQTYPNFKAVVVDNRSRDGSLEAVRTRFPQVRVIENDANAGWGIACNVGIEATAGEYVALLNNDAYLDEHCLEEMVRSIRLLKDYGSCASKILLWDDPDKIEVAGLVIYRDGLSVGRGRLQPADRYNDSGEVFCANDCCCLYRREMLNDIGLYDPDFFIYADETDMGWRHQLAGWKCIYTPRAIAYHAHSSAAGIYSDFKAYHVERNRIYLCLKYFPIRMLIASFFFAAYRYGCQVWAARKGRGSLAKYREHSSLGRGLRLLFKIHLDAFRMAPVMLRRRRDYRPIRRLSNGDIEALFRRYGITAREVAHYE
jgi:GT2 family glycosyltransferase